MRGSFVPWGWLAENGSIVAQATYPALFAVIGSTYNTGGEGVGNFRLPDSRGRADIGSGTGSGLTARTLGAIGGAETHQLTVPEMPSHSHTDSGHSHSVPGEFGGSGGGGSTEINYRAVDPNSQTHPVNSSSANITSTGGGGSHNNMQPFIVATRMIKW